MIKRFLLIAVLFGLIIPAAMAAAVNSSTLLYIPMNGSFVDISPYAKTVNNSGFVDNATNYKFGSNAGFSGNTPYGALNTTMGSSWNLTKAGSISFWIHAPTQSVQYATMFDNWASGAGGISLDLGTTPTNMIPRLVFDDGGTARVVTATKSIKPDTWTWVAIVANDAGAINVYLNGTLSATYASHNIRGVGNLFRINNASAAPGFKNATYDDFVIYDFSIDGTTVPTKEYVGDPPPVLIADFTQSANPSIVGQAVTFTDTSTGTPTAWNWTIDGTVTNTTQDAAYTFSSLGTYYVNLSIDDGASTNITNKTHTVANATGFALQDIWMAGQYLQTFTITDSGTLAAITNVTIVSSSGKTYVTTNGTGYLTEPFGLYTVTFSSTGYSPRTITYVFDADESHALTMTLASESTDISLSGTPKDVKFHVTSFFGAPIPNAVVYAQGISTTTGSFDWVAQLFSIDFGETPIQNTSMSDTTDSNGDIVFLMIPSIKYNITTVASGYTFPATIIAPQAKEYTLVANMNETWFSGGNDTLKDVNVSVSWVKHNDTFSFANITYLDDNTMTTGGTIKVFLARPGQVSNASPVAVMNITSSSCSNSTLLPTPTGGADYTLAVNATLSNGENVYRTFTHYFKGSPVNLPGWTDETLLWLSLFIIIFTAGFAGALHSPQMSVILCVEAWIFWGIGWLDALMTQYWYTEAVVVGIMVLATFLSIWWNIAEGKAKGKRSS